MAKLIVEENIKSKHPDSFKILKSKGYKLLPNADGDEDSGEHYHRYSSDHRVHINNEGKWKFSHEGSEVLSKGKSHSDLKVHLDKVHK